MRHFKAPGEWFLGDDPENRVAGILRYSNVGLRLKLLGSFHDVWHPKTEKYPFIHGVVGESPYGSDVTLIDGFTQQRKLSSAGIVSETIYFNRALIGDSHLQPDHDAFEALGVRFSHLGDWFGMSGIETEARSGEEFGLDLRYRKPEPVRVPIGQQTLLLGMTRTWSKSPRKFGITEEAQIHIEPLPRLTVETLHGDYVRPLQNLLSFATDTHNDVEEIKLRGEKVAVGGVEWNRKYNYVYTPIVRLKPKKNVLQPADMLFTFEESRVAGLNIFEDWLEFTKKHEAFCAVYFSWLDAPPKYLDEKFLRLMSALTLLGATLGNVSARTAEFQRAVQGLTSAHFTEEERGWLGHVIPTLAEVEMPFRMHKLLEEKRTLMSQLVGDDLTGFVKSVSETLAYVERRTIAESCTPLQGTDLFQAIQKIHFLIRIVMLNELGFGEGEIARFVTRNRQFVHLKSL